MFRAVIYVSFQSDFSVISYSIIGDETDVNDFFQITTSFSGNQYNGIVRTRQNFENDNTDMFSVSVCFAIIKTGLNSLSIAQTNCLDLDQTADQGLHCFM